VTPMVRLLFLLLFLFLGYTLIRTLGRFLSGPRQPPPEKTARGEDMARDPLCATFLTKSDAIALSPKGKHYFFCSPKCRDAFLDQK